MNLRRASADLIGKWEPADREAQSFGAGRADLLLADFAANNQIDPRDYGLVNATVLGCLRNLSLIDFWISQLRDGSVDRETKNILRVGLCELLILDQQPHATVNECVEAPRSQRSRGLINAILRRADREREELLNLRETLPLHLHYSHPKFLVQRWIDQFGEENTEALLKFNQTPSPIYVRSNPLRPAPDTADLGSPIEEPAGFFKARKVPREAIAAGHCYIQDPSTAHAVSLLAPQAGEHILDACAAPGGKAGLIAGLTNNEASLTINEPDPQRIDRLTENLDRMGVKREPLASHEWGSPEAITTEPFDAILADVPCSNSGVIGRRVDVRWRLSRKDFRVMPEIQRNILSDLLTRLKPNGRLVYSTCSIDDSENGDVVRAVLDSEEGAAFTLVEERHQLPFRDKTDGAYAALIRRI